MVRGDWTALFVIVGSGIAIVVIAGYLYALPEPPGHKATTARVINITYSISKSGRPGLAIRAKASDGRAVSATAIAGQRPCHVGDIVDSVERGMVLEIEPLTCRPPPK